MNTLRTSPLRRFPSTGTFFGNSVFERAPSTIERRAIIVLPGCTLHTEIARMQNHLVTNNQQRNVMMKFDAKLCPGDYEDKGNEFNGTVEIDVDNHKEDWNGESEEVCKADISQQSSVLVPIYSVNFFNFPYQPFPGPIFLICIPFSIPSTPRLPALPPGFFTNDY
ncbi:unnamed protein product [Caenorhabditis brenneri]